MKIHNLFFSPTGGTKTVARLLADALGGEVVDIDLSVYQGDYTGYSFGSGDLCVVAVPAFGGRAPSLALQSLQQMQAHKTNTIVVVTYGNRHYDDTLLELRNTLVPAGFHVIAGIAAVTEHSILRQFGAGRPDEADRQELLVFAKKLSDALGGGVLLPSAVLPGKEPYREYAGVPFKPTGGRGCTACGVCARQCPAGAITVDAPKGVDKGSCISCMRCIAVCPAKARSVNKLMLKAAGKGMAKVCGERKGNLLFFKP